MDEMETLKKRVKIFHDLKTPVHVVTKSDTWLNGYVVEVSADFFIVLDRIDGKIPIFYEEVRIFDFFVGDFKTLKKEGENGD